MADYLDPNNIVEHPSMSIDGQSLVVQEPNPAVLNKHLSEGALVVPPEEFNDDLITLTIKDDELPDAVLKAVLLGLAEEQMALKSMRQKNEKAERDISGLSIKRGTLLKYMSETLIQRQALVGGSGEIDLKSPKFREIIKMFLGIVSETMEEIKLPLEYKDLFFHSLAQKMDGWELKAQKILKSIK